MKSLVQSLIIAFVLSFSLPILADEANYIGYFAAQIKQEWYKLEYSKITPNRKLRAKIIDASEVLVDLKDGIVIKEGNIQTFRIVDRNVLEYLRKLPDSTNKALKGEIVK